MKILLVTIQQINEKTKINPINIIVKIIDFTTSIKNSRKCETIGICLRRSTINWIARAAFGINEVAKDFSYGSFADEMNRTLRDE